MSRDLRLALLILALAAFGVFAACTAARAQTPVVNCWQTTAGSPPRSNCLPGLTAVASTAATSAAMIIKATPGVAFHVHATASTSAQGFLILLNSATIPGDGAVQPIACRAFLGDGEAEVSYNPGPGQEFSTGLVAVVSSAADCFTKTTGAVRAFISALVQ